MTHHVVTAWLAAALVLPAAATSYGEVSVNVPGVATIWLAGQPDGTAFSGDVAPASSPVAVDLVGFDPALPLEFTVSGATASRPSDPLHAADGNPLHLFTSGPVFDVSRTGAPLMSLVGVFFDEDQVVSPPSPLYFTTNGQRSFAELAPEIQQTFFIGDGRRGVGTGPNQGFHIPDGADLFYLALFDGGNYDNRGEPRVTVASVPEPSNLCLVAITGCGMLFFGQRLAKRRRGLA